MIILGVGFIMIAAVFPVAIKQSKSTADETSTAAFAGNGAAVLNDIATDADMSIQKFNPPNIPGIIARYSHALVIGAAEIPATQTLPYSGSAIRGKHYTRRPIRVTPGSLLTAPTTRQPNTQSAVSCTGHVMVCVQSTLRPTFTDADIRPNPPTLASWNSPAWNNLRPRPVTIEIANGDDNLGNPDLIGFSDSSTIGAIGVPAGLFPQAVAEGSYVIVRADIDTTHPAGRLTGKVYRVGAHRPDLEVASAASKIPSVYYSQTSWQQQFDKSGNFTGMRISMNSPPGNDFQYIPADLSMAGWNEIGDVEKPIEAWVVGRSIAIDPKTGQPDDISQGFDGPAMDVGMYSTFVYCKQ